MEICGVGSFPQGGHVRWLEGAAGGSAAAAGSANRRGEPEKLLSGTEEKALRTKGQSPHEPWGRPRGPAHACDRENGQRPERED